MCACRPQVAPLPAGRRPVSAAVVILHRSHKHLSPFYRYPRVREVEKKAGKEICPHVGYNSISGNIVNPRRNFFWRRLYNFFLAWGLQKTTDGVFSGDRAKRNHIGCGFPEHLIAGSRYAFHLGVERCRRLNWHSYP